MKWDFAIGNPPYHEEDHLQRELSEDSKRNYAPPVYNIFLDESYKVANAVEMIHPARFLFNAGSTPKAWNNKMLNDTHLKVLYYEPDSEKFFRGITTPIKGGIAITYRNPNIEYGAIKTFTRFKELNDIVHKVTASKGFYGLDAIVYSRTSYRLTNAMHKENPWAIERLSDGHAYDMSSNIMSLLPEIFLDHIPDNHTKYVKILGRDKNQRIYKYIKRIYINSVDNLNGYKVLIPQATGRGDFGETFSSPVIEGPMVASTETFISIGNFRREDEANALKKYICSKFSRTLLGVLKVTQNGNKSVWRYIPLQDFSENSDINWNTSVANIDKQLYKKYGLSPEEIDFIETHVKEMA